MQPGFLSFYGAVLNVAQDRQNLIANNIANADTPGFKAADVDFTASLAQQLESPGATPQAQYRADATVGLNGNDVDLDAERVEDAQNGEMMQGASTFLHQSTADLITALRPNPNGT